MDANKLIHKTKHIKFLSYFWTHSISRFKIKIIVIWRKIRLSISPSQTDVTQFCISKALTSTYQEDGVVTCG